ncbi:MAG: glycosidase [Ignavibacteriales bacterium]|jgi:predicted GH43/DUF377 family glycosyl hydrolase|nr:MAG: glycosidase [Ignavibacteriales bacterium]
MNVQKLKLRLKADPRKVIIQPLGMNKQRTKRVIDRIIKLSNSDIDKKISEVYDAFSNRHKNFETRLQENYNRVKKIVSIGKINRKTQQLIGAYFSKEYSIESAALFNPSIVPHPAQDKTSKGELKFVMSLRATGEGHISSIEFREGIISASGSVKIINESAFRILPKVTAYKYKEIIDKKNIKHNSLNYSKEDLMSSNYKCMFEKNSLISERVLFPSSNAESMGMEDARFVKFTDEGNAKYLSTYTAYNGKSFRTQLIETKDFRNYEIGTLHGNMINDKGMALFPRKIKGKYFITSRQDGENLYMMESDNLYQWDKARKILQPKQIWEFVQLGNCGSPIETKEGWLLLTHAVGPLRKYVMSAILLDLNNPYKVIAVLKEPLIEPDENEREGYVPNVVYSCGSLVHNNNLIIPYAMSDSACGFAKIELNKIFNKFS